MEVNTLQEVELADALVQLLKEVELMKGMSVVPGSAKVALANVLDLVAENWRVRPEVIERLKSDPSNAIFKTLERYGV